MFGHAAVALNQGGEIYMVHATRDYLWRPEAKAGDKPQAAALIATRAGVPLLFLGVCPTEVYPPAKPLLYCTTSFAAQYDSRAALDFIKEAAGTTNLSVGLLSMAIPVAILVLFVQLARLRARIRTLESTLANRPDPVAPPVPTMAEAVSAPPPLPIPTDAVAPRVPSEPQTVTPPPLPPSSWSPSSCPPWSPSRSRRWPG